MSDTFWLIPNPTDKGLTNLALWEADFAEIETRGDQKIAKLLMANGVIYKPFVGATKLVTTVSRESISQVNGRQAKFSVEIYRRL